MRSKSKIGSRSPGLPLGRGQRVTHRVLEAEEVAPVVAPTPGPYLSTEAEGALAGVGPRLPTAAAAPEAEERDER